MDVLLGVVDGAAEIAALDRRSNASATAMAAATTAVEVQITSATKRPLGIADILYARRALMRDDPGERDYAGRLRDMQNWIGASDHSPRDAVFVPPPPATVHRYMEDLIAFFNRSDLPALAQAALAHAQFESIHPFTDGNGRIGRAVINAVLRRSAVTRHVVVPIASALVAHRDRYFDLPDEYRAGWATQVAAFTAEQAQEFVGGPLSSTYTAIERMAGAAIIRSLTDRRRNQVWGVAAVLDELDDLGARIARRTR